MIEAAIVCDMESVGKRPKASPPCIGVLGALRRIGALVLQARWCCRHVGAAGALAHWCIECIGAHWCISASHAFGPPPAVAAEAVVQQMRQLRVAVGHVHRGGGNTLVRQTCTLARGGGGGGLARGGGGG